MIIKHLFYNIEIDTESEKFKELNEHLIQLYSKIPATKCILCPNKCGVEADCCKVFSPPMLLMEFFHVLSQTETLNEEQRRELLFKCIDSFMNLEINKPCVLLENNLCSVYIARPLACRLFGLYPDYEWNAKLKNIAEDLETETENVPFYKQCRNLEVEGTDKIVPKKRSDKIFRDIHELDVCLFDTKEVGNKFVFDEGATYMPFETHYICYKMGKTFIQALTEIKLELRDLKKDKNRSLDFIFKQKNAKEFVSTLKNVIVRNNIY